MISDVLEKFNIKAPKPLFNPTITHSNQKPSLIQKVNKQDIGLSTNGYKQPLVSYF